MRFRNMYLFNMGLIPLPLWKKTALLVKRYIPYSESQDMNLHWMNIIEWSRIRQIHSLISIYSWEVLIWLNLSLVFIHSLFDIVWPNVMTTGFRIVLEIPWKILDTFELLLVNLHWKEEKTLKVTEICSIWLETGPKQLLHHLSKRSIEECVCKQSTFKSSSCV